MIYSKEIENMCCVARGANHGSAPIPEEGKWVKSKEVKDISGLTHGIGWCAPQQGTCKLTLNVKEGIIEEALVETLGCSGMTHSAAMAGEILVGKTILEALNSDLATTSKVDISFNGEYPEDSYFKQKNDWIDYGFYHRELKHDSVRFYSDYLNSGNYHLSYSAQVIAVGTFKIPSSYVEEMYNPDIFGRGDDGELLIFE